MTTLQVNKCYKSVKEDYVGKFLRRLGGSKTNTGMMDVFLKDGKEVEVIHNYPGEYSYVEVNPCKTAGGKRKTAMKRTIKNTHKTLRRNRHEN